MQRRPVAVSFWLAGVVAGVVAGCSFDREPAGAGYRCDGQHACPGGTACSAEGTCELAGGGGGDPGDPTADGGVPAPPTVVQEAETTWTFGDNGTTKQTPEFEVQAGDVLVAYAISENADTSVASINGGGLAWTSRQTVDQTMHAWLALWSATATEDRTMSVAFTLAVDGEGMFGADVLTFRGSGGVGASAKDVGSDASAHLSLTTTQPHSAVVVAIGDWDAQDGTGRVWLDDAGALDELSYFRSSANYASYGGVHRDAGDEPGDVTVGLAGPPGQVYSIAAIEVLGGAAD
jgi:hypothetical protein